MSTLKLIAKNKAKFSRQLVGINEIGQFEDGTWQIGLRFGDGSVAQFKEKDTAKAMSFLAEMVNVALSRKPLYKADGKEEANTVSESSETLPGEKNNE